MRYRIAAAWFLFSSKLDPFFARLSVRAANDFLDAHAPSPSEESGE